MDDDGETKQPLLHSSGECRVPYVDGCPGCKILRRKLSAPSAPPTKEFFLIAIVVLSNSLPISSLFPFIYFMIDDLNVAFSDTEIAYYAGFVGSAFMIGRFVSSAPWGFIADRYGRKPVILLGTAAILIFNTMFGFSKTYWMALLSRFLLGLFNGLLGTIRAYVSEVATEEQQAFGMSLVGTMWGLGLIIGPAIGGYLARPSLSYPAIFPAGSLFDEFPYALPCICISGFALLALITSIWIPETLHKHPTFSQLETFNSSNDAEESNNKLPESTSSSKKAMWRNWELIASISLYCIWSIHDMAYTEIFSLWAVSPITLGGLGLTTSDVGVILAISGGSLLLFQLCLYPCAQHALGPVMTSRVAAILSVPVVVLHPLIAKLDGWWVWVVVTLASILKVVLSVSVMTSSFILINNSVTTDQRGVANGVSMSFMSLFKAIGPATAGALLSWSETRMTASFLPGTWMVFCVLALFCCFTLFFTFDPILPRSLDHPKPEPFLQERKNNLLLQRQASFSL